MVIIYFHRNNVAEKFMCVYMFELAWIVFPSICYHEFKKEMACVTYNYWIYTDSVSFDANVTSNCLGHSNFYIFFKAHSFEVVISCYKVWISNCFQLKT